MIGEPFAIARCSLAPKARWLAEGRLPPFSALRSTPRGLDFQATDFEVSMSRLRRASQLSPSWPSPPSPRRPPPRRRSSIAMSVIPSTCAPRRGRKLSRSMSTGAPIAIPAAMTSTSTTPRCRTNRWPRLVPALGPSIAGLLGFLEILGVRRRLRCRSSVGGRGSVFVGLDLVGLGLMRVLGLVRLVRGRLVAAG